MGDRESLTPGPTQEGYMMDTEVFTIDLPGDSVPAAFTGAELRSIVQQAEAFGITAARRRRYCPCRMPGCTDPDPLQAVHNVGVRA